MEVVGTCEHDATVACVSSLSSAWSYRGVPRGVPTCMMDGVVVAAVADSSTAARSWRSEASPMSRGCSRARLLHGGRTTVRRA